jgi:hypothetical protein
MTDRRELILARLPLLAAAATGLKAVRNANDFSDLARPCVVTLDGDEEPDEGDPQSRPSDAPRRVALKAQFVILASGLPEDVGTKINGYRAPLLKAVVNDATLLGLVFDSMARQSIRYHGATLTLNSGRQIEGELRLDFAFAYALIFSEL